LRRLHSDRRRGMEGGEADKERTSGGEASAGGTRPHVPAQT
jgi:hypothetical protein